MVLIYTTESQNVKAGYFSHSFFAYLLLEIPALRYTMERCFTHNSELCDHTVVMGQICTMMVTIPDSLRDSSRIHCESLLLPLLKGFVRIRRDSQDFGKGFARLWEKIRGNSRGFARLWEKLIWQLPKEKLCEMAIFMNTRKNHSHTCLDAF